MQKQTYWSGPGSKTFRVVTNLGRVENVRIVVNLGTETNLGRTVICHRCRKGAAFSPQAIWKMVTRKEGFQNVTDF